MKASEQTIHKGDTVIFLCDEYRDGDIREFDGHVLYTDDKGVDILYLSGYKSRNDYVLYQDVIAKVDQTVPWIELKNAAYSGCFVEFERK